MTTWFLPLLEATERNKRKEKYILVWLKIILVHTSTVHGKFKLKLSW